MDPELEEEDELRVDEELRGGDEERGREVEPVGQLEQPLHAQDGALRSHTAGNTVTPDLEHWLSEGRGQVELLAAVVNLT